MTLRSKLTAALLLCLLALGGAILALSFATKRASEERGSASASIGGSFSLVSADGKTVTDATYRGKWLLIYFGYTFCPDACPTALNSMSVALQELGSEAGNIQPIFVTVDPKRDTVDVVGDYLKAFDPRIIGLTGSQAQVDSVAKNYGVYVAPQKSDGDDYLVDHSGYIYLMNPRGQFVDVIVGNATGDQMAAKLRTIMAHPGT